MNSFQTMMMLHAQQRYVVEMESRLKIKVPEFTWGVINSRHNAGLASWKKRSDGTFHDFVISLSPVIFSRMTPHAQRETVIHEICHLLHPEDGHGHKWGMKMLQMNCDPRSCWDMKDLSDSGMEEIQAAMRTLKAIG